MENNRKAKYPFGTKVLIEKNIVGIVLSSWEMFPNDPKYRVFLYRVIVDHNELTYRVINKKIIQTEQHLFDEDFTTLFHVAQNIGVVEVSEEKLTEYNEDIDFEKIMEELY